jgi:hypothetical protein
MALVGQRHGATGSWLGSTKPGGRPTGASSAEEYVVRIRADFFDQGVNVPVALETLVHVPARVSVSEEQSPAAVCRVVANFRHFELGRDARIPIIGTTLDQGEGVATFPDRERQLGAESSGNTRGETAQSVEDARSLRLGD